MSKIAADSISSRSGGNIAINNNVNVVGVVTATSFSGNGANLTGITAGVTTSKSVGLNFFFGY